MGIYGAGTRFLKRVSHWVVSGPGHAKAGQEILIVDIEQTFNSSSKLLLARWVAVILIGGAILFGVIGWRYSGFLHYRSGDGILDQLSHWVATVLEIMAILSILVGAAEALYTTCIAVWRTMANSGFLPSRQYPTLFTRKETAGRLINWLFLGLELAIAADIIRTAVSPQPKWEEIGGLAAIIGIRALLGFVVRADLEASADANHRGQQPGNDHVSESIKRAA